MNGWRRVAAVAAVALATTIGWIGQRERADADAARAQEDELRAALEAHFAALERHDVAAAGEALRPDFFYIAPWGALEYRDELLARYREAFAAGRLRSYRVELRGIHSGPAGDGGRWFRMIVRETYERESGRRARNAFAEDLLSSGVAVLEDGVWRIQYLQQTWSDETLRRMVPILHAAQPVDPEEY